MVLSKSCPICEVIYEADTQRLKHGRNTTCSRACSYKLRGQKRLKPENEKFNVREYNRKYYLANQEKLKANTRQYVQANRDKVRARAKIASARNKKSNNERARLWYQANKQLMIDRATEWKKNHPDHVRANTRDYATRRRNAVGKFSSKDYIRLLNRHHGLCAYCGINKANSIDHVVPLSKGGSNYIGNILPVCGFCNSSKGYSNLYKWKVSNGNLLTI